MALRAVTFDVYSALFDIIGGLAEAIDALFKRRRIDRDAVAVARLWRQKHMECLLVANSLEHEPALNRRAIEASARHALRWLDPPLASDEEHALVAAWERLPLWPEAAEVLQQVRRRQVVVAALSNGDEDMLVALLAALPATFDLFISTEGGKFKPHPSVYRRALERLGIRAGDLLHVAGSPTDAMGATAAGIQTVWINRAQDAVVDGRFAPAYDLPDLRGVVELVDALQSQE